MSKAGVLKQQKKMSVHEESSQHTESHFLCGGTVCQSGERHCRAPCLVRKSFEYGYAPGNLEWICCFVANYLNRKGVCSCSKISMDDMCPCGSGKPMGECVRNESE